jgi:hypothetical protein
MSQNVGYWLRYLSAFSPETEVRFIGNAICLVDPVTGETVLPDRDSSPQIGDIVVLVDQGRRQYGQQGKVLKISYEVMFTDSVGRNSRGDYYAESLHVIPEGTPDE